MSSNTITMLGVDEIVIDARWAKYLPEVEGDALDLLADSIQSEGIREPLTVTANKFELLDGHRRLAAAKQIGLKQVPTVSYHFADDAEKELFVVTTQLQRRNLTPERLSYMRGRRYDLLKRDDGGHGDQKSGGQIDTPIPAAEIVAKQMGVSPSTVKRDAQFAAGVDKIEEALGLEASKTILDGTSTLTKAAVAKAAKATTPADVVAAVSEAASRPKRSANKATETKPKLPEEPLEPWAKGHGFHGRTQSLRAKLERGWNHAESAFRISQLLLSIRLAIGHREKMCAKRGVPGDEQRAWLSDVRTSLGYLVKQVDDYTAALEVEVSE